MKSLGLDLSLSDTGVVLYDSDAKRAVLVKSLTTGKSSSVYERFMRIRDSVSELVDDVRPDTIAIEGFVRFSPSVIQLAGLGSIVRLQLAEMGYGFWDVPPTTLKKFSTGKGNCKKDLVLKEVYRRWKFDTDNDNIADAYVLARMGVCLAEPATKAHHALIKKTEWIAP